MPMDSTGQVIVVGDQVRFRGQNYIIKEFVWGRQKMFSDIVFTVESHTNEIPNEVNVDLVRCPD